MPSLFILSHRWLDSTRWDCIDFSAQFLEGFHFFTLQSLTHHHVVSSNTSCGGWQSLLRLTTATTRATLPYMALERAQERNKILLG